MQRNEKLINARPDNLRCERLPSGTLKRKRLYFTLEGSLEYP